MKNTDRHTTVATLDEHAPAMAGRRSSGAANPAMPDATDPHRLNLARALRLGRLLHIRVLVDESGWLRDDIEIAYRRERGNTIRPISVRIGLDARDEDVLADGGPVAVCRRYNSTLAGLGQLAASVRAGKMNARLGSPLAEALRELDRLAATIAERQLQHMGHGVVRLRTLLHEIAFLDCRLAELAAIASSAEIFANTTWDGDTQEMDLTD
jgi:hypothetical protein